MYLAKPSILSQIQSCHKSARPPECIALRIIRSDADAPQVALDRLHSLKYFRRCHPALYNRFTLAWS